MHARPDRRITFPADHGSHPEFRMEWWYLTANLEDEGGRALGAQWTLFRLATDAGPEPGNPWQDGQVWMAHMAVTGPDGHRAFQRYARGGEHGGVAQAGVTAAPFAAWLDDWRLESTGEAWLPLEVHAGEDDVSFTLRLDSDRGTRRATRLVVPQRGCRRDRKVRSAVRCVTRIAPRSR